MRRVIKLNESGLVNLLNNGKIYEGDENEVTTGPVEFKVEPDMNESFSRGNSRLDESIFDVVSDMLDGIVGKKKKKGKKKSKKIDLFPDFGGFGDMFDNFEDMNKKITKSIKDSIGKLKDKEEDDEDEVEDRFEDEDGDECEILKGGHGFSKDFEIPHGHAHISFYRS